MFSLGALTIMALDLAIPHIELTRGEEIKSAENTKMFRSGVLIAIGVTLHNLPEGLLLLQDMLSCPH
jgi:zinc transporter ZupT